MKTSNQNAQQCLDSLFSRYPVLESCEANIVSAYLLLYNTYKQGGKLLLAGNGGSAADAEHIVGELMKSFLFPRPILAEDAEMLTALFGKEGERLSGQLEGCLPAIPLTSMLALSTAFLNDVDPLVVFAQLVYGYGCRGDVFLGISTSGNSQNILNAAMVARAKNMPIIGLTGRDGGKLAHLCDAAICVPEEETFKIQELHLPIYHTLCAMLEADFFGSIISLPPRRWFEGEAE